MAFSQQKRQPYSLFLRTSIWLCLSVVGACGVWGWEWYGSRQSAQYERVIYAIECQVLQMNLSEAQTDLAAHQRIPLAELKKMLELTEGEVARLIASLPKERSNGADSTLFMAMRQQVSHQQQSLASFINQQPDDRALAAFKERERILRHEVNELKNEVTRQQAAFRHRHSWVLGIIGMIALLAFVQLQRTLVLHVWRPIQQIQRVSNLVASGNLSQPLHFPSASELGQVANAIDGIISYQSTLAQFVGEIGNGQTDAHYQPVNEQDYLGANLVGMHRKIVHVAAEESRRHWINEGQARFATLLRNGGGAGIQTLTDTLLPPLVKYLGANQGAFFIVQQDANTEWIERMSTYAWERKKWVKQRIAIGEGLIGQVVREGDPIYLTDIPQDFVTIRSGLGNALPQSILIVPLKVNDSVHGVLELAAFKPLDSFEIEFVTKLAESIAATLASVRKSEQTQRLLEESRQMNAHLRSQEEVLRQNAEEMQAIQEEMRRKEVELARQSEVLRQNALELQAARDTLSHKLDEATAEMKSQIARVESEKQKNLAILEGCVDAVISFDQHGQIDFFNHAAEDMWGINRADILTKPIATLIPLRLEINNQAFVAYYQKNTEEKPLGIRTEITVNRFSGEEMDLLLTLTHAQVGDAHAFTAFAQRVSVELF